MARKFKYKYGVDTGTFAVTGNSVTFARAETAATGTYTLTGNAADLHKNVTPSISTITGDFLVTGNNANLLTATAYSVSTGTFSLVSPDATFVINRTPSMIAGTGSFASTFNDATLVDDVLLTVDTMDAGTGEFLVTGSPVTFILDTFVDECHPAFQLQAFQFNAFQECLEDEPEPETAGEGHGGRQQKTWVTEKARWPEGAMAIYARKQVHDAAVALGRKGGLTKKVYKKI